MNNVKIYITCTSWLPPRQRPTARPRKTGWAWWPCDAWSALTDRGQPADLAVSAALQKTLGPEALAPEAQDMNLGIPDRSGGPRR